MGDALEGLTGIPLMWCRPKKTLFMDEISTGGNQAICIAVYSDSAYCRGLVCEEATLLCLAINRHCMQLQPALKAVES